MIQEFVERFNSRLDWVRAQLAERRPFSYRGIFQIVVEALHDTESDSPDPEKIQTVDFGHYQGTEIHIVGGSYYQPGPESHWATHTYYGSCSGCDTLQRIQEEGDPDSDKLTDDQLDQLMALATHMVQRLKPMF